MDWLPALVFNNIAPMQPTSCLCRESYVFRAQDGVLTSGRQSAKLIDVVRHAGVSTGTVSNVLNHPDRIRVELAIVGIGFVREGAAAEHMTLMLDLTKDWEAALDACRPPLALPWR
ncbi:LacI family DNA-binding transcriptional regulator [Streptomyces sp. NPDC050610]|uniref:LacI family DNA-binding transcriptional regulator n=1 Tax=Streptomyces sp. NPDC050610 TaxID=3157097 RepID=UPI0034269DDE